MLDEFYRVDFRNVSTFETVEALQAALDAYLAAYKRASQHPSVYVAEGKRLF